MISKESEKVEESKWSTVEVQIKDHLEDYTDDEAFGKLAKNKQNHDALVLANCLYGTRVFVNSKNLTRIKEDGKKKGSLQFSQSIGEFNLDASIIKDAEHNLYDKEEIIGVDSMEYYSLSKDYKLNPIKKPEDFSISSGVTTNVILFDRKQSSEYDEELREKINKMRERGVSTNLSSVMTKSNTEQVKENYRKSQEDEVAALRANNKKEGLSKVSQMKALLAQRKQQVNKRSAE